VLLSVQLTGLVVEKYSHSRHLVVTQVLSLTLHTFLHISIAMELKQSYVCVCGCVDVCVWLRGCVCVDTWVYRCMCVCVCGGGG